MADILPPPADIYRTLAALPETLADDKALREALTYEVMNYNADLADRDPGQQAWDELDDTIADALRFLGRAAASALMADDEEFCPDCFAGIESSEHHEKCIAPLDQIEGD